MVNTIKKNLRLREIQYKIKTLDAYLNNFHDVVERHDKQKRLHEIACLNRALARIEKLQDSFYAKQSNLRVKSII